MNGQMKNYKASLNLISEPILPSQLPQIKIDLKGMMAYAKHKKISVKDMSEAEKEKFFR